MGRRRRAGASEPDEGGWFGAEFPAGLDVRVQTGSERPENRGRAMMLEVSPGHRALPVPAGKFHCDFVGERPSLLEEQVWHLLVGHSYPEWDGQPGREHAIQLSELIRRIQEGTDRRRRVRCDDVLDAIRSLATRVMELRFWGIKNGKVIDWEARAPIFRYKLSEAEDILVYKFTREFEPLLMDPARWAPKEDRVVLNMTSSYALKLYERWSGCVATQEEAMLVCGTTELARMIGHPIDNVSRAKLQERVVGKAVEETNRYSEIISVTQLPAEEGFAFGVATRDRQEAGKLGLWRPKRERGEESELPAIPPKGLKAAFLEKYPHDRVGPWWAAFRQMFPHRQDIPGDMLTVFMGWVETSIRDLHRDEENHSLFTVPDQALRAAVMRSAMRMPRTGCKGAKPGARLLALWHATLKSAIRQAKTNPRAKDFVERAQENVGATFKAMVEEDKADGWKTLRGLETGGASAPFDAPPQSPAVVVGEDYDEDVAALLAQYDDLDEDTLRVALANTEEEKDG